MPKYTFQKLVEGFIILWIIYKLCINIDYSNENKVTFQVNQVPLMFLETSNVFVCETTVFIPVTGSEVLKEIVGVQLIVHYKF